MSNETNDPKAPYGEKREPMIDELALYNMCREAGEPVDAPEYCGGPGTYSAQRMRKAYEALITKGDLIRKDELTKWLNSQIDPGETAWNAAIESVKAHIEG